MGLESLNAIEILRGSLSLIFVVISVIIGLKILSTYFKYQKKEFITVGLTWIFLSTSWWWPSFNFLSNLLFDQDLSIFSYLILANFFIPLAIISWIYSIYKLAYQNKIMIISISVICVTYEILLFLFLFINPNLIGIEIEPGLVQRTSLTLTFAVFSIAVALISGILMAKKTLASEDRNIKWKGRFLIIAIVFFTIGAVLDAITWTNLIIIFFIRLLLILSSIAFYFAFFLPERVAKLITKE